MRILFAVLGVWSLSVLGPSVVLAAPAEPIALAVMREITASPDGRFAVVRTGGGEGTVWLVSAQGPVASRLCVANGKDVTRATFSENGEHLALELLDGEMGRETYLFDTSDPAEPVLLTLEAVALESPVWVKQMLFLVPASADDGLPTTRGLVMWDPKNGSGTRILEKFSFAGELAGSNNVLWARVVNPQDQNLSYSLIRYFPATRRVETVVE